MPTGVGVGVAATPPGHVLQFLAVVVVVQPVFVRKAPNPVLTIPKPADGLTSTVPKPVLTKEVFKEVPAALCGKHPSLPVLAKTTPVLLIGVFKNAPKEFPLEKLELFVHPQFLGILYIQF